MQPQTIQPQTIQRQYDEVIAPHYDLDPQAVIRPSLDRAVAQVRGQDLFGNGVPRRVLDLGIGTGLFLAKLKALAGERLQPFGLDLSQKMIETACRRLPDLVAAVGDAADLAHHFPGESFDLICTHFITGFVPMRVLAPLIRERLAAGGFWSLVGGTKAGFPTLQAKANGKLGRRLSGGRPLAVDDIVCNPAGRDEVVRTLEETGFAVRAAETFEPPLTFRNLRQFMDFAYHGGWLTPFVETVGLHKAGLMTRWLMNWFFFPVKDHHSIEIVLAQKKDR
jgi:SAM-dependent methyltransferase